MTLNDKNDDENEAENEKISQRHNINRSRPRHGQRFCKYKMYLSIIMVISIKQH